MADLIRIQAIKDELVNDPVGLGYSDGNPWFDEAKAMADIAILNVVNRSDERESVTASELDEAIDENEEAAFAASGTDEDRIRAINRVFQIAGADGTVDIRSGTKARAKLELAFTGPGGPLTRANLGNLLSVTVSRADELSLGKITTGDIQNPRNLP